MSNNINFNDSLDCLGLYCPVPIIKTYEKVKEMKAGEILEVISDDEGIIKDMPAWCKTTGNEFLGFDKLEDNVYKVYVKKK